MKTRPANPIIPHLIAVLALGPLLALASPAKDVIRVEVTGTLRTGIMAIGGETTGTLITSGNVTWELDLKNSPEAKKLAPQLNAKKVIVTGTYEKRKGVEIALREIVTVDTLRLADAD